MEAERRQHDKEKMQLQATLERERREHDKEAQRQQQEFQMKFMESEQQHKAASAEAERNALKTQMEDMQRQQQETLEQQKKGWEEQQKLLTEQVRQQQEHTRAVQAQQAKDFEEYKTDHATMIKQHEDRVKILSDELEKAREEPFDPNDQNRLVRKEGENFTKFCQAAREHLKDVKKLEKYSVAVLGPSGVGKSTIINCFAGYKVAKTGATECTQEISMVHGDADYDFYDVPGNRDHRADFYNVDNLHKLKALHLILVIYESRFEHVLKVLELLRSIDLPHVIVRNKFDFVMHAAEYEAAFKKEQDEAGNVPLLYLGRVGKDGDTPENFEQLKSIVHQHCKGSSPQEPAQKKARC